MNLLTIFSPPEGKLKLMSSDLSPHNISVGNPEKHGDSINSAYISYELTSIMSGKTIKVRRRYQDFLFLHEKLTETFPERVLPPLPDKNRLEFLGRFTPDFIKKRQAGLRRFLRRLDRHPILGKSDEFIAFMEQPVVGMNREDQMASFDALPNPSNNKTNEESSSTKVSTYLTPLVDSFGDVLTAAVLRTPQNVDESFVALRKNVHTARAHLSQLERLFNHRVTALQPTIIEGMSEISSGFEELSSAIDINLNSIRKDDSADETVPLVMVKSMLSRVSATMTQCRSILTKSMEGQETQMHAILAEMVQYCDGALEIILLRDRRQVEQEELQSLLKKYERERDEICGFEKVDKTEVIEKADEADEANEELEANEVLETNETNDSTPSINPSFTPSNPSTVKPTTNTSFMSYLTAKWDAWKGIDPITARQNRLSRLNEQIAQVSTAAKTASDLLIRANESLSEEISIFEGILRAELGAELKGYTGGQIHYHESNLVYWRDFLSWLENPPKHLN